MARRSKTDYVNKNDLLDAMTKYIKDCDEAEASGDEIPIVPNYIGICLQDIAKGIAARPNFSGYSYKEDMINDGIENCLRYIRNFDVDHPKKNPFGYFSRIIWYAYLRRIEKEKKQMYVRFKSSQELLATGETYYGNEVKVNLNVDADYIDQFIKDYESKGVKNDTSND